MSAVESAAAAIPSGSVELQPTDDETLAMVPEPMASALASIELSSEDRNALAEALRPLTKSTARFLRFFDAYPPPPPLERAVPSGALDWTQLSKVSLRRSTACTNTGRSSSMRARHFRGLCAHPH